jgi:predicted HD superfamily hydrolase involved in NAD metabolism
VIGREAADALVSSRLSAARLEHSRRVAAKAAELARRFGVGPARAEIAGLLHDYAREEPAAELLAEAARLGIHVGPVEARRPVGLLHAPVGAAQLLEEGHVDLEAAGAIARHTVGGAGMTDLQRCLYLADFCEPGREFDGLSGVRELALSSLDAAVAAAARVSLLDLIGRGRGVVPDALALYNESHAGS